MEFDLIDRAFTHRASTSDVRQLREGANSLHVSSTEKNKLASGASNSNNDTRMLVAPSRERVGKLLTMNQISPQIFPSYGDRGFRLLHHHSVP